MLKKRKALLQSARAFYFSSFKSRGDQLCLALMVNFRFSTTASRSHRPAVRPEAEAVPPQAAVRGVPSLPLPEEGMTSRAFGSNALSFSIREKGFPFSNRKREGSFSISLRAVLKLAMRRGKKAEADRWLKCPHQESNLGCRSHDATS